MFDENNRFVIRDYQQAPAFSSFLPGVAGPKGVPAWVYYNNRGQGVCSFGAKDKDHAIMEFSAAHTAYQNNARTGFRTFARVNGSYTELFRDKADMHIGTAEMMIRQSADGLDAQVLYCGLPDHRLAGLIRVLTVTNTSAQAVELELLDGMPAVVCYGVEQDALKNMAQLAKAWMQAEFGADGTTRFAVRASMADTACVTQVEGVNFCLSMDDAGNRLHPLVNPALVFEQDTGLEIARGLARQPLKELCALPQVVQNIFPCCFAPVSRTLQPGESVRVFSLYGQAENRAMLEKVTASVNAPAWFDAQCARARELGEELSRVIDTRTADPVFDAYCRQTCVDNLLRGGMPIFFEGEEGKATPFYLYSRKHGDPEREYNYFSVGGEYYAQGNGNFRDVNQNRRCDVLFHPRLRDANIRMFYELTQSDGYNPLVILPGTFRLEESARQEILATLPAECAQAAQALLSGDFTPGRLAMAAEDWGLEAKQADAFVARCVTMASSDPNANFGEGYWCDHWTYDLDLIESYLAVYPERKQELLLGSRNYRWYASQAAVLPLAKRCCLTENGLRQYASIDHDRRQKAQGNWLVEKDGTVAVSTLMEKLLLLCAVKAATLDPAGMGVEMEGGKPGWYDALNGLPGLFGSSMAESCELERMLGFAADALEQLQQDVELYTEMAWLLKTAAEIAAVPEDWERWQQMTALREEYRKMTGETLSGERVTVGWAEAAAMLRRLNTMVQAGIRRAEQIGSGLIPTYFQFRATGWEQTEEGIVPTGLVPEALPYFLEGPVRRLKTGMTRQEKEALADAVQASDLYDKALKMYKVNASLQQTSFEIGRARAFTPGWLENESIWLHMEYKYLLELLKSGLYERFFAAFQDAAVPFLDPAVYGRSPLENVSFIASSANPDPSVHGRGFVARLSGSTAEFLQMWQLMFFGAAPFTADENGLQLSFAPALPRRLVPEDGLVRCTFLGQVAVVLHCGGKRDMIPGSYQVKSWTVTGVDGSVHTHEGAALPDALACMVRDGKAGALDVVFA